MGVDFQYSDSSFFGPRQRLQFDALYERSFSNTRGDDAEIGAAVVLPNEPWGGQFNFKQIGQNFYPALGFVNRPNIRFFDGFFKHRDRWRDDVLHWADVGTEWTVYTDLHGNLESRQNGVYAAVQTDENDQFQIHVFNSHENVEKKFNLPQKVPVLAGSYDWNHVELVLRTTQSRSYFVQWDVDCCRIYSGKIGRAHV